MLKLDANGWSSIGSLVNAGVEIVLAGVNVPYLRAANRQAKASEDQARAASESLRLALWGHSLERERQLKRVVDPLIFVQTSLDGIADYAKQSRLVVDNNLVPQDWVDVETVCLLLYPDLRNELDKLKLSLDSVVLESKCAQARINNGESHNLQTQLAAVIDAQNAMSTLRNKMKQGYPFSAALLHWQSS